MKVQIKELDDAVIIGLTGKMMLGYEAQDFQEAISGSLEKNKKKIVVDLSNLEFISSWGMGMIMYGFTSAQNKGKEFICAGVSEKVRNSFSKTKLDSIIKLYDSVEKATNETLKTL